MVTKELGGKKLPIPPATIHRHSHKKLLTPVSESDKSVLSVPTSDVDNADVEEHKDRKKQFKDFESQESERSVSILHKRESDEEKSTETENLTDDDNHNRQSDDSLIYCDDVIKEKCGLEDVNLPDSKVECEEVETADVKLEKKRKPMIIASHITVVQGNTKIYMNNCISSQLLGSFVLEDAIGQQNFYFFFVYFLWFSEISGSWN